MAEKSKYIFKTNKQTDSKRYAPSTSNHPRHCLTNIPFSLARRIDWENVKQKRFNNWKKILLEQKYSTY